VLPFGSRPAAASERQPSAAIGPLLAAAAAASLNHNNIIRFEKFHSFSYPNTHTQFYERKKKRFTKLFFKNNVPTTLSLT
jgi:hypothetical protein